jgi:anthranilate phosphoribosyltransferase
VATVFNFLGPLTNPAQPVAAAVGVADARMAPIMAGVFADRGASVLLFRGEDGLDELSTTAPSRVWAVGEGRVADLKLDAVELGLPRAELTDLVGAGPAHNAAVVRELLEGRPGPVRDAVLLNAAAAAVAADGIGDLRQEVLAPRMRAALHEVAAAVDEGAAAEVLRRWIAASNR